MQTGGSTQRYLPISRAKGAQWGTLRVYLEVKPHLQDKEKQDLLLSVNPAESLLH